MFYKLTALVVLISSLLHATDHDLVTDRSARHLKSIHCHSLKVTSLQPADIKPFVLEKTHSLPTQLCRKRPVKPPSLEKALKSILTDLTPQERNSFMKSNPNPALKGSTFGLTLSHLAPKLSYDNFLKHLRAGDLRWVVGLQLGHYKAHLTDQDLQHVIIPHLCRNNKLLDLSFRGITMSSETGSLLQKSLPHLLALDFSYVMMTPGDPHKWEFLTSFKRLERLTLDGTDVPSHVITNLGYVRKLSLKKMQHLGREVLDV